MSMSLYEKFLALDMVANDPVYLRDLLEARLSELRHCQEELNFCPAAFRGDKSRMRAYKAARMRDVLSRAEKYKATKAAYLAACARNNCGE